MKVNAGDTNVTTYFTLRTAADGTATTGATITDMDLQYVRSGAAPSAKVDVIALAATDSDHSDNKAIEIDGTDQPGLYRVDWPDAAFTAGVREVILTVKLANSFTEHLRVKLSTEVDDTADAVWDEALTGAAHNIATSAGKRLRQLASPIITEGVCQAGSDSISIVLANAESAVDGMFDPALIAIIVGTGAGQARTIFEYLGAERRAYVNRDWKVIPDETSEYIIYAFAGNTHVNEGLAQGAGSGANTLILNTLASSVSGTYIAQHCFVVAGAGADQVGKVLAYDGPTKEATMDRDWVIAVDNTSVYAMLPAGGQLASDVVTALFAKTGITAGGSASFEDIIKAIYSRSRGKIAKAGNAYAFLDDDDSTTLFTLTIGESSRTVS